jgi:hypothetical protein
VNSIQDDTFKAEPFFFLIQLCFTGKKLEGLWANAGIPGNDWLAAQHEDGC